MACAETPALLIKLWVRRNGADNDAMAGVNAPPLGREPGPFTTSEATSRVSACSAAKVTANNVPSATSKRPALRNRSVPRSAAPCPSPSALVDDTGVGSEAAESPRSR